MHILFIGRILLHVSFFYIPALTGVFCWSLGDMDSPRVFRTLRSITAEFSDAMVWMASIFSLISSSLYLLSRFLEIVLRVPITESIF